MNARTDYNRQRRIPGRGAQPYAWRDHTRAYDEQETRRRVRHAREEARRRAHEAKIARRNQILGETLKYVTIIVVVFVLFMEIGKLSEIASQGKSIDSLKGVCQQLVSDTEAYQIQIDGFTSRANIENSALELGMIYPEEGATRVIQLVNWNSASGTYTADGAVRE